MYFETNLNIKISLGQQTFTGQQISLKFIDLAISRATQELTRELQLQCSTNYSMFDLLNLNMYSYMYYNVSSYLLHITKYEDTLH